MPPSSPVHSSQPPPVGWRSTGQQDFTRLDELHAAQAQSAQLRALHAAVLKNTRSPSKLRSSPPKSRPQRCPSPSSKACANRYGQDYPVFTPSYEEFVLRGRMQADHNGRNSIDWEAYREAKDTTSSSGLGATDILSSVRGTDESPPTAKEVSEAMAKCSFRDSSSSVHMGSIPHHITSIHPIRGSSGKKFKSQNKATTESSLKLSDLTSRKKLLSEFLSEEARKKAFSEALEAASRKKPPMTEVGPDAGLSCDRCRPGSLGSNVTVVPLTDSRDFSDIPPKERNFADFAGPKDRTGNNNPFKSWFSRVKKKPTSVPTTAQSAHSTISSSKESVNPEVAAKDVLEIGMAMDSMELKVSQANKKRDAALVEVMELRLAMGEMGEKLEYLEQSCQSLKHALERRMFWQDELEFTQDGRSSAAAAAADGGGGGGYYSSWQEGRTLRASSPSPSPGVKATKSEFFHAVTEARVGVKQLCRTLVQQIQESSSHATEKIDTILRAYNVRVAPRVSRSVRYHLESLINQAFYEDFENIKFEKNGTHCILDPNQRVIAFYKTYLTLAKLSWNEVLSKESSSYSESFDRFCAQKMEMVESVLNWEGRWPDELAQAFFEAARCVWMVHLLAFAMEPATAAIFRVGSEAEFDGSYMEELPTDHRQQQQQEQAAARKKKTKTMRIKLMVMPGFFLPNDLVKCKVLCSKQTAHHLAGFPPS